MSEETNATTESAVIDPTPIETPADPAPTSGTAAEADAAVDDFTSMLASELPETPAVFDPTAPVDESAISAFDSILGGNGSFTDAATAEAARASLDQVDFGTIDIQDFTDFNAADMAFEAGEISFSIEQKELKAAASTTGQTVSSSAQFGAVRVTIYRSKLRLQTFNQSSFSENIVPLATPCTQVDEDKNVSFIFDHSVLNKIAQNFTDSVLTFNYVADKSLLIIRSGETRLELSTYPKADFTDYHSKIGTPNYVTKLPAELLRQSIDYAALFVRKDDVQNNLSLIELREGGVIGGTLASIGVFKAPALNDIAMKVKYEIIKTLVALLPRFEPENTHLFETDSFYIIRDEHLYFGFEKTSYNFPPVDKILENPSNENVLVPRAQLLNSLYKLSVVSVARDLLVHVQVEGVGNDAKLTLVTKDSSGKPSRDTLNVLRRANIGKKSDFANWDLYIDISAFIKVVGHFDSANVQLEVLGSKALLIVDEGDNFDAKTILAFLSEEQVARQRAARETAKSATKDAA